MLQPASAFAADPELIEALKTQSQAVNTTHGGVLFRQGDPSSGVFILEMGAAILTMKSDDTVVMQIQIAGGALLGLPAILGNVPYTLTAEVIDGSEVSFLSKADFTNLLQSKPLLSFKVLQILAAHVRFARRALSSL